MKKFTIAITAALALASAAPAIADTATNDDPFVSTQSSPESLALLGNGGAAAAIVGAITIIAIVAAGDS